MKTNNHEISCRSPAVIIPVNQKLPGIIYSRSESNLPEDGTSSCPTYYLRDVWDEKPRDTSAVFVCNCSVQQILKVSLKYVCDHCGSMVKQSRCSNIGCFSTEMGRFLGRARYIVIIIDSDVPNKVCISL